MCSLIIRIIFYIPVGSQSERHHYRYRLKQTTSRMNRSCAGQMEREVYELLGPVGVTEKVSQQVADNLMVQYAGEEKKRDVGQCDWR